MVPSTLDALAFTLFLFPFLYGCSLFFHGAFFFFFDPFFHGA